MHFIWRCGFAFLAFFTLGSCDLIPSLRSEPPAPPTLDGLRISPDDPLARLPRYVAFRPVDLGPRASERTMEVWGGVVYSRQGDTAVYGTAASIDSFSVPLGIDAEVFRPSPRRDMVFWSGDTTGTTGAVRGADPFVAAFVYSVRGQRKIANLSEYPGNRVLRQGDCGGDTIAPALEGILRANGIPQAQAATARWSASLGHRNSGTQQWLRDVEWMGAETLRLTWTMEVWAETATTALIYGLEAFDLTFSVPPDGPAQLQTCELRQGPLPARPLPRTIGANVFASSTRMLSYGRKPVLSEGIGGAAGKVLLPGKVDAFLVPDPLVP